MIRIQIFLSHALLATSIVWSQLTHAGDARNHQVLDPGQQPEDVRLRDPKDLNAYFPFEVPESKAAWEQRQEELKQRVLVATGLWPMPEKTPLNPVIHGKVERDGFTMEKVYFESLPGHFVTGMLFRPIDAANTPGPAVLCPHGHGGRLQKFDDKRIQQQIENGEEFLPNSGRMPKLARCAQLARMGCVTFIYDMLGYADSRQISFEASHRYRSPRVELEGSSDWGFFGVQAESRLHSILGLQTWNSVRGLDFLAGLPDVDPGRIAVTGGSGGGTQTILLGAIDDRPVAAYPNGMVSTGMQGGCTCENCSLLRVGTGNVELAAAFAPRPQSMTAVNDWTRDMMSRGFPELKRLYTMLGAPDNVDCVEMLRFPHNYNAVTRQLMYSWMNRHLDLGFREPIVETDWPLFTDEESAIWNDMHPAPPGGIDYERRLLKQLDERDREVLFDHDPASIKDRQKYARIVRAAWETIIARNLPDADDVRRTKVWKQDCSEYLEFGDLLTLTTHGEQLPVISLYPKSTAWNQQVVLWVDGDGKSGMFAGDVLQPDVRRLVNAGYAVVGTDLAGQGEFTTSRQKLTENRLVANPRTYAGFTYTYNNSLFVQQVHDLLTMAAWINGDQHSPRAVHAVGVNGGGAVLAASRAMAGDQFDNVAIATDGFRFAALTRWQDAGFVPGAVKYGDLPSLLALSAPYSLWIGDETHASAVVTGAYAAAGEVNAVTFAARSGDTVADAVNWLLSH
ncbi:MAG: alpha/beta hydrolase family protein [Fuerstiella sp.]|nr:alpha/beta hydrolase family protein [Fuerstiella sp.]